MTRTALFAALVLVAAGLASALRVGDLNVRPVHCDEAVHFDKFNTLWATGTYRYDPEEYHGPTLYYLTLPAVWLSGAANFQQTTAATYRVVPVVFGVGLVLLVLLLADGLGRPAAVGAAALTAVSPALVFYSRYYIQETLLVFFTMVVIGAGWRYVRSRRVGWVLLAGAGVGLMHATKETGLIALAALAAALLITMLWTPDNGGIKHRAKRHLRPYALVGAAVIAVLVSVVLYSAFFTNAAGPLDSLRTYGTYFERAGSSGQHDHPWDYYLRTLIWPRSGPGPVWTEALIVVLALVGIATAVRRTNRIGANASLLRFLAVYTVAMTIIYSAIPYKTPWCALGLLHGLILLAGVGAAALVGAMPHVALRGATAAVLLAGATHLGAQAVRANEYRFCADPRNPYVYAHTVHDAVRLTEQLDRLAAVHPHGHALLIKVMVDNCWPLPWYLRGFGRVGYWETVPEDPDADVILASFTLQADLAARLQDEYQVTYRGLRRDEVLAVYVRQDLWDAFIGCQQGAASTSQPSSP